MSYISQIKLPNNTTYDINSKTVNGHTVASDVPSNAVFTDTNNAVTQTSSTTNSNFEILLSGTADDVTRTEGANKSQYALFNPNKKAFTFGTRAANSSIGEYSTSEGSGNTASGAYSHVEGLQTSATYSSAHAEGAYTSASGGYAHAEGYHTTASVYAHAEGNYTTASGYHSHAEGYYTTATHKSQHVFGEYNVLDTSSADSDERGTYVEIVGKGTADNARSNARTLDWSGNEVLAGNLTIGGQLTDKWGLQSIRPMTRDAYNALSYAEQHNGTYYHLIDVDTVPSLDCNVKQTPTTESASYRILLSSDADDTEHTDKVFKNTDLRYYPSGSSLSISNGGEITLGGRTSDPDASFSWLTSEHLSVEDYWTSHSALRLTATDLEFPRLIIEGTEYKNTWDGYNSSLKTAINETPSMINDTYPTLLPKNRTDNWIKIGRANTSFGLIPSQAGTAGNGHNYLGTSSWYWANAYIDNIYGTINTPNNTWNPIGDDVQMGDINVSGCLGIQGRTGNTGLFFTTYNQSTKNSGCSITANGSYFYMSHTVFTGGDFWARRTGFQLDKSSNNGCTAYKGVSIGFSDGSNQWVARTVGECNTSGQCGALLQVRNMTTSGSTFINTIGAYATKAGGYTYTVSNAANFRSAIGAAASSSILTKTNIEDIDDNEVLKILDVKIKSFDYKEGFVNETDKKDKYYGVIAEDIKDSLPYMVNVPENYSADNFDESAGLQQDLMLVDYVNFVPYLIRLVQIQEKRIQQLEDIQNGTIM